MQPEKCVTFSTKKTNKKMEEILHSHNKQIKRSSFTMMLPCPQENQMSNQCEFGHQFFPLTLREQPDQKL